MRQDKTKIKRSQQMGRRRTFNNDFKRQIAEAIVLGQISQLEVSRKYAIITGNSFEMENNTLKEIIKLVEPPKKSSQQIFTSADWGILKRSADR